MLAMNKAMLISLGTLSVIIWSLVAVGIVQDMLNNPFQGCARFSASARYTGYFCANGVEKYTTN